MTTCCLRVVSMTEPRLKHDNKFSGLPSLKETLSIAISLVYL